MTAQAPRHLPDADTLPSAPVGAHLGEPVPTVTPASWLPTSDDDGCLGCTHFDADRFRPEAEHVGWCGRLRSEMFVVQGRECALRTARPPVPFGIHADVAPETYYLWRPHVVRASGLKLAGRSMRHYFSGTQRDTRALAAGRAFHAALLEPERYATDWGVPPERRGKGADERRAAWREEHPGIHEMTQGAADQVAEQLAAVHEQLPFFTAELAAGLCEVTVSWQDDESGLACLARPDWLGASYALDVKTCQDASPRGFGRAIARYEYDVSASHYLDGLAECGHPRDVWGWLAVETAPPYTVGLYYATEEQLARGREIRAERMERIRQCVEAGRWPGYTPGWQPAQVPEWRRAG